MFGCSTILLTKSPMYASKLDGKVSWMSKSSSYVRSLSAHMRLVYMIVVSVTMIKIKRKTFFQNLNFPFHQFNVYIVYSILSHKRPIYQLFNYLRCYYLSNSICVKVCFIWYEHAKGLISTDIQCWNEQLYSYNCML